MDSPQLPRPSAALDGSSGGVLVVGAGIAGLACAIALREAGVPVTVVDRGRRPGGRMSGRRLHGRPVDLGAAYFTVPDATGPGGSGGSGFAAVVAEWTARGLARGWTDTLTVLEPGTSDTTTGPLRHAAPAGLRSLVGDLADAAVRAGAVLQLEHEVTEVHPGGTVRVEGSGAAPYDTVVLAMPEPQAVRLLPDDSAVRAQLDVETWEPVISVALGYPQRSWPAELHGAFVNGSDVISFLADDGDRRGDGAPVLVAHTTADLAHRHLDDPESAVPAVIAEVEALLGLDPAGPPVWTHAHRWTFARATSTHPEPYLLDGRLAVCGDAWGGRTSVATAWESGHALGRALGSVLGSPTGKATGDAPTAAG
ncbi:FAD-dependent oxidoreductase [Herbiconiux sp. CPCC 203407]|uniref:FAD-dependent oxidoreductase n=1 Tax=Herbiconiux oxytropis TaxID=2970915 RepID=A0AA41XGH4_9MICO|nr:FAD-dependent oxidoreductase [Herbiconiux oxytropis]MCS5722837.1 FAD-dependent oxidoreductase [Herbiconiux oxytropis]MCS5727767.1 FAD-dependent oxidoreductase [Herbiconiux oxytropis]